MKTVDQYNIGIIIVATIIYIILCYQTKYRSVFYNNNQLNEDEYRMLYITTVFGFFYGTILASFQQRYLEKNISSIWIWVFILFICVMLTFSAFYSQVYTDEDTNSFLGKFSYAVVPILPSLVMMIESSISQILNHGIDNDITDYRNSNDSFDELIESD